MASIMREFRSCVMWESRWADFFKLLQENATLDRVVEAEQYLADSYPMELARCIGI